MGAMSLRLPDELHERIKVVSDSNHRSINAEIVHRLLESLTGGEQRDRAAQPGSETSSTPAADGVRNSFDSPSAEPVSSPSRERLSIFGQRTHEDV